ncbi:aldose 1-epimerase [Planobispora rosea]|uniref:Aldose 1-epimerase n=1 Tax=Planobispora rosea TaxID=35762 RepID=A0A8J3SAU4_PLARO|nr:aldose epimerase family protein [Planobispora rosea]GGT09360.1 aldose 1-epimerase [Planobispora rosea]GIH89292.1 aldose 1-epimerase [Planobispora rosea]
MDRHILSNGRMRAGILTLGAIVQSVELADGTDVVLGLPTVADYLTRSRYFGAVVGRYGNRIAGGRFTLDGTPYRLPLNDNGSANSLHGGTTGFDKRVWRAEPDGERAVRLTHVSEDGEEGYPGTLTASVTYTLTDRDELRIDYHAVTDAPTVLNLTNHSYFNLAGSGDVLGHVVTIEADEYLPVGDDKIPLPGAPAPVAGTPYDFTRPAAVGARLSGCYDHCYVLRPGGVMRVEEPVSGRSMEVTTTEPGVQFYTGHMLDGVATPYGRYAGLCLETQHFPDSPNRPDFPSTVLRPGEEHVSSTTYRFVG